MTVLYHGQAVGRLIPGDMLKHGKAIASLSDEIICNDKVAGVIAQRLPRILGMVKHLDIEHLLGVQISAIADATALQKAMPSFVALHKLYHITYECAIDLWDGCFNDV